MSFQNMNFYCKKIKKGNLIHKKKSIYHFGAINFPTMMILSTGFSFACAIIIMISKLRLIQICFHFCLRNVTIAEINQWGTTDAV